ncbi:hypothetical protein V3331_01900 [Gaopeijia maritima]|uniref:hypothetical protein n=1 Tax=Gaopeijia maritima TaxID=3119007 RepID=UPI003251E609
MSYDQAMRLAQTHLSYILEQQMASWAHEARDVDVLYHYTTARGAIGILRENEIWATDTRLLNDRTDHHHAIEVAKERLEARRDAGAEPRAARNSSRFPRVPAGQDDLRIRGV